MKKKFMVFGLLGLAIASIAYVGFSVHATSDDVAIENTNVYALVEDGTYTLEDMLVYALEDEYLAQATYEAIIETYGEVRPFTKIVLAEQTHIDLLLPLFATYGIEVPENNAKASVVIPDSISSALATGIEAEKLNIALYDLFLSQGDLPEDVYTVFEYLQTASQHHLAAFSKDRLLGVGYDLGNMIKNQFRKGGNASSEKREQMSTDRGIQNGDCINT